MSQFTNKLKNQSGNAVVIILVVVALAGIGALAYFSGYLTADQKKDEAAVAEVASEEEAPGQIAAEQVRPPVELEPGNPVVARVGGEAINRLDVFAQINAMPVQMRQQPLEQVFAIAQDQVVNEKLATEKSQKAGLENNPEVIKQVAEAKKNIIRNAYVQQEIDKRLTEDRLRAAYNDYVQNFPEAEEVKASHILVETESTAKEIIKKLDGGADFAELAKEYSTDGTAQNGGDLGYFTAKDVVPVFADAAFSTEPGTYTKKPVKSDFGYHVIYVQAKRTREPETFEAIKPFLEPQLRQQILTQVIGEWRENADVQLYDVNGKPLNGANEAMAAPAPAPSLEENPQAAESQNAAPEEAAPEQTAPASGDTAP